MSSPFYDDATILRLLLSRYILIGRTQWQRTNDLQRLSAEMSCIISSLKLRGLLDTLEARPYAKFIRITLDRSKRIVDEALTAISNGQTSKYFLDTGISEEEDNSWGDEIFIAKAKDMVQKFRGHCRELHVNNSHPGSEQQIIKTCQSFQWYLTRFPLINQEYELPPRVEEQPMWFNGIIFGGGYSSSSRRSGQFSQLRDVEGVFLRGVLWSIVPSFMASLTLLLLGFWQLDRMSVLQFT
ncbi:hypothetical protein F5Y16DRAFT_404136 [Xylariaceae sp. FL0255]|nr:hypothetical protein F5Y16DRAFT_404136 [Xylariaceae sp. FL0255]